MTSFDTIAKSRPNPSNTATSASSRQTSPNRNTSAPVTQERIARRAYEIWERAGRPDGQCEQNWRQAEEELRRS